MVFVAIAAIDFGAIRAVLDYRMNDLFALGGVLLLLGALPMANVLLVGMLIAQRRPGSSMFLVGFEWFGAMALALFIALVLISPVGIVSCLIPVVMLSTEIARENILQLPFAVLGSVVLLGLPQLGLAVLGGLYVQNHYHSPLKGRRRC